MSRIKKLCIAIGALGIVFIALIVGGIAVFYVNADMSNVGQLDFENPLSIPPLLEPETDASGRKVFDLELQTGVSEFMPGKETETWGINGAYLGPTLRASRGDEVLMRVQNNLPEMSTLHWHGMHLPAAMDGGPHQMVEVGETWSPSWTIDQPAATLWYHPHPDGRTEEHVYRGVAGMFILDDPEAAALDLPDVYGVNDIPVIVQDRDLRDGGAFAFSQGLASSIGRLGRDILVNGTYDPHIEVTHEGVRLRLLNASPARIYNFGFDDGRQFDLIATDGGLLESPARLDRVMLSPGERAELVVELQPGERVILRSFKPDIGDSFAGRFNGGDDTFDILQIRAAGQLTPSPEVPSHLVTHEPIEEADSVKTRSFQLNGSSRINNKRMNMDRIDEVVTLGTTEIWEVRNSGGMPHSFHVHDVQFKLLEYAGEAPPPQLSGWKDTVFIPQGETVRLITRFTDYSDPNLPYMYHCHILQHEDSGMMGQFVVVAPGEEAGRPPGYGGEHEH